MSPSSIEEIHQFQQLVTMLQNVSFANNEDNWCWVDDGKGVFSVKGCRKLLGKNRNPVDLNPINWSNWIPYAGLVWSRICRWIGYAKPNVSSIRELMDWPSNNMVTTNYLR